MSEYEVAHVRFSENGKPYPVNCRFTVEPRDFVIVRLQGKFTPLQKAQVVSTEMWKGQCKHSVVCLAKDEKVYGSGPEGVETEADLERFLVGFLKLKKFAVVQSNSNYSMPPVSNEKWHVAYMRKQGFGDLNIDGFARVGKLVLVGRDEIIYRSPDSGEPITMAGGALLVDRPPFAVPIRAVDGNIYSRTAAHAEWPLAVDLDPRDTSLSEIKDVIGGDGYLSDGVYL